MGQYSFPIFFCRKVITRWKNGKDFLTFGIFLMALFTVIFCNIFTFIFNKFCAYVDGRTISECKLCLLRRSAWIIRLRSSSSSSGSIFMMTVISKVFVLYVQNFLGALTFQKRISQPRTMELGAVDLWCAA